MKIGKPIILVIGIMISGLGFYLAFHNIPLESLIASVGQLDCRWLLPAIASLTASYALRAVRWRTILSPFRIVGIASVYHAIMIGFMFNCILPGRLGEIVRPVVLNRREDIPVMTGLSTLAAERIMDLAALLALLALSSGLSLPDSKAVVFGPYTLDQSLLYGLIRRGAVLALILLTGTLLLGWTPFTAVIIGLTRWIAEKARHLGPGAQKRVQSLSERFIVRGIVQISAGLEIARHPLQLLATGSMSLALWALNALAFYFVARSFNGIHLNYLEVCMMMVIICLFIALPSVPGYWGLWEAAGLFALTHLGVPQDKAAGYTLFNHAFQVLPVLLAGWSSCLMLGFRWSNLTRELKIRRM